MVNTPASASVSSNKSVSASHDPATGSASLDKSHSATIERTGERGSGMDALKRILGATPKDTPDSDILIDKGGAHFTVGALRHLFAGEDVGKYNPHTGEYDPEEDEPEKKVVSGASQHR